MIAKYAEEKGKQDKQITPKEKDGTSLQNRQRAKKKIMEKTN